MPATRVELEDAPGRTATNFAVNGSRAVFHMGNNRLLAAQQVISPTAMVFRQSLDGGLTWDDDVVGEQATFQREHVWDPLERKLRSYRVSGSGFETNVYTDESDSWGAEDTVFMTDTMNLTQSDFVGIVEGCGRSTAAGNRSMYDLNDVELFQEQTDGTGTWGDPQHCVAVMDAQARVHIFWYGAVSSSRSNLNTWWHRAPDGTHRALKTDVSDHHQADISRPVAAPNGKIYAPLVARDGSAVDRLWLCTWDPDTETWSNELVHAEWEPRNTTIVVAAVDRIGQVFILTNGEIDSIATNLSQVYLFTRDTDLNWAVERVAPSGVNVGGAGVANFVGLDMSTTFLRLFQRGTVFGVRIDWDATTDVRNWIVIPADTVVTQDEEPPTCPAEPTRTSIVFANEGTSAATLTLVPDFAYEEEGRYYTNELRTHAGYVVTSAQQASSRRLFRIGFVNRSEADRDALVAFLDARKGGVAAWTFTRPEEEGGGGGDAVVVHLLASTLEITFKNPDVYDLTILGQELLNTS